MSTHDDDDDTQVLTAPENGHGPPSSVFEMLRRQRAEHVADNTYDIDVPGYNGLLIIRCGPLPGSIMAKVAERREASRSPERDFNANADTLIAACREVLARTTPDDEPHSLDADEPMMLDERLAEGLGLEAAKGRALVRQLFGAAPIPEVALADKLGGYIDWAKGVNTDADEAYTGESKAARR